MARRGLDWTELKKYHENLKNIVHKNEFEIFLKKFLLENAEIVIRLAKQRTPADTGALRASWGLGEDNYHERSSINREGWAAQEVEFEGLNLDIVDVDGNNITVMIWNGMEYASHVEFGTPARPVGRWAHGAHMLTIALDEVYKMIPSKFKKRFDAWKNERGL